MASRSTRGQRIGSAGAEPTGSIRNAVRSFANDDRRPLRPAQWPRKVWRYYAGAPATMIYLFTLLITWSSLQGADQKLTHHVIVYASTNLHNMANDPIQVLVVSAFWTDSPQFPWGVVAEFLLLMAVAEHWLGTRRWITVFAFGHVGATIVTVLALGYAVDHAMLPERLTHTPDVGSSYGMFAVVAACSYHWRGRWRALWAAALVVLLGYRAWTGQTFTDYGHLCAVAIGLSSYPVGLVAGRAWRSVRHRSTRQRELSPDRDVPDTGSRTVSEGAHRSADSTMVGTTSGAESSG